MNDVIWKEFVIGEMFELSNSTSYHKSNVEQTVGEDKLPYITRTSLNNGIEMHVKKDLSFNINAGNQIVFGAENADFFYQEYPFITGNKMYLLNHEKMNKPIGLFLVNALRNAIKGSGFGYSLGMTATRLFNRKVLLPTAFDNEPDWKYMETIGKKGYFSKKSYIKEYLIKKYDYLKKELTNKVTINSESIDWSSFKIEDVVKIKSGVRLTKNDQSSGRTPFIGASEINNGITNFVSNTNKSLDFNILGVNYNGAVVESFYHPYNALFSDDVKRMEIKNKKYQNKYTYLYLATSIEMQQNKYMYSYKFNAKRMKNQYIMLPVNREGEPDWEYMENYMKKLEYKQLTKLINFLNNKKN